MKNKSYLDNPLVMQWQSPLGMLQAVCDSNGSALLKLDWVSGMAESEPNPAWPRDEIPCDEMPLLQQAPLSQAPLFQAIRTQINAYCEGQLRDFDLPIRPMGTEFQRHVWQTLRHIPYGHTASYQQVAQAMGHPTSVRAVAAACGRNPLILIVPCHRVIGSDGTLTGYSAGLPYKRALLALEAAIGAGRAAQLPDHLRAARHEPLTAHSQARLI